MPRCPFAVWKPISGPSGTYTGGPFKIVHHTTEGSSAQGAFSAFEANRSDPHFTVDANGIFQHIDTAQSARALRNPSGGVETNRDSAVQIEVVGFAHRPKIRATLENVRRLCRWIEAAHGVPKVWPNGPPKPAVGGQDPGGHNRHAQTWDTKGGHYGHSNVPENTHWDPAYSAQEVDFLMLDSTEGVESLEEFDAIILEDPGLSSDMSRMPDHAHPNDEMSEAPEARAAPSAKRRVAKPRKVAAATPAKRRTAVKAKAKASRKPAAKRGAAAKRKAPVKSRKAPAKSRKAPAKTRKAPAKKRAAAARGKGKKRKH